MKSMKAVITALVVVASLAGGLIIGVWGVNNVPFLSGFSSTNESRSSQIVDSVTVEDQVVLLSLGIQGLEKNESNSQIAGWTIPGSDKTSYIPYAFKAKLGIEGSEVLITETEENSFHITVPEFIFIGHSDVLFESAVQGGGALHWMAPQGDQLEMVNQILSNEHQEEYVGTYRDILQDQAELFYTRIVQSIDSSATLTFEFVGADDEAPEAE